MFTHILSPIDGSPVSTNGMMQAIRLAKDQGAKLRFIHVLDKYFPIYDLTGDIDIAGMVNLLQQAGHKVLEDAEAAARRDGLEVDSVLVEAVGGRVADFIVDHAKQWPADLIVMGTHGRRGFRHLVLGSDAEDVSRLSPVPVLLIHGVEMEGGAS